METSAVQTGPGVFPACIHPAIPEVRKLLLAAPAFLQVSPEKGHEPSRKGNTVTITQETAARPYRRMWFELTNKCQLACTHCYADSGPDEGHGAMSADDWTGLADQAADEGISLVQFIGGEPTLRPAFPQIMSHALKAGLNVEVYTNLVRVTDEMWDLFQAPGVNLAFSYYSPRPDAHNAVTRRDTHARTRSNAAKAVALGIPIRAGIIDFGDAEAAEADLRAMGITKIATDRVRGIGRGGDGSPAPAELCGRCGTGAAAVSADGDVSPCIFSRWLTVGNVRQAPLADILSGPQMTAAMATIPAPRRAACDPNTECNPGFPPSSCDPRN